MTRPEEQPESSPRSAGDRATLPEVLENALFEIYFDAPPEERKARFEALLESHPDHVNALRNAKQALGRSEHMLGNLRAELGDAISETQRIGPFDILKVLGEGGFGTVYLAEQQEPVQRRVALKVLHQRHCDERSQRRFEAERQLLARLQHENIAQVFDAGVTEERQHYLAMEFVDGKPITTWCEQADASVATRLQLFLRVCTAIQHAHQREVVHRDLKPSNVLVHDQDGQPVPKVIDFGIAKLMAAQETTAAPGALEPTLVGAQVGTPGYMSPEQAAGEWIDTRTDVYSLGVLLCELLTGEQPLPQHKLRSSSFVAIAKTLAEEPPRRPSSIVGRGDRALLERLREDLDWIVIKAVAPQRDDRYTSIAALAEDVKRHIDNEPVLARQNATGYLVRKFVKRHRIAVALVSFVAAALVATLLGLTWGLGVVGDARAEAERDRDLAESRGAATRMAVAQLALDSGDAATTRAYLQSVAPERRHWGWRHLASRTDHSEVTLAVGATCEDVIWLDESRVIAFPLHGEITCWNVDTGQAEYTFDGWQDWYRGVAFARERGIALVAGNRDISLWDVHTGKRIRTVHRAPSEPLAIAWSEDRALAAIGSKGCWLDLVPIRLGGSSGIQPGVAPPVVTPGPVKQKLRHKFEHSVSAIAFCENHELLLGFHRGEVRRIEPTTAKTLAVMRGHTDNIDCLLVDEDGDRLYSASVDTTLTVWDLEAAALRAKRHVGVRVYRFALDKDRGILFAGGGWTDNALQAWDTSTCDLVGRYNGHLKGVRSIALSPDKSRLVTGSRDEKLRVWSTEPPRGSQVLEAGRDARRMAVSRDGSRFATASTDGLINVWDARTLEPELALKTGKFWAGVMLHDEHVYVIGATLRAIRISDGVVVQEVAGTPGHRWIETLHACVETDRLFGCYVNRLMVWRLSDLTLLHDYTLEERASRFGWNDRTKQLWMGDDGGILHTLNTTDGTIEASSSPFGEPVTTDDWHGIGALAFHDDLFVVGAGRSLRFDRHGQEPITVTVRNGCAAISPDTRRVVTGGVDHKVRLWDPDTGDQLLVLGGIPYNIRSVHFVDGGQRIIALAHRWTAPSRVHVWTAPDRIERNK